MTEEMKRIIAYGTIFILFTGIVAFSATISSINSSNSRIEQIRLACATNNEVLCSMMLNRNQ